MRKIDEGYDKLLWSNYELCASTLFELRDLAKSWYVDIDFSKFDNRRAREDEENELATMKQSGLTSNYFFAYLDQDGKYYLMDGFNRLFTDYGKIETDCPVYIKIITDELEDWRLMHIMFRLNMWKLQGSGTGKSQGSFRPDKFFDRGFRLFLSKKFGIDIYTYDDYQSRLRERSDFNVLHKYFRYEHEFSEDFPFDLDELSVIMSRDKIVEDIKHIIDCNNFLELPFPHYDTFLDGFIMFLSGRRIKDDMGEYKFEHYLDLLKNDDKFFKKLKKMSWTDSTRKNVYTWFRSQK